MMSYFESASQIYAPFSGLATWQMVYFSLLLVSHLGIFVTTGCSSRRQYVTAVRLDILDLCGISRVCLFAGGWTQNRCRFFIHLMYESFVIMPRQLAKLRIHVVLLY